MDFRLGIVGCAGTGKSVLGELLSARLSVPFLPAKQITGDILRRDNYDYASGIQVEKFLSSSARQREILQRTKEQQSVESFVTDRTSIDLASYAILEMEGALDVKRHLEMCEDMIEVYTHLLFCPWMGQEIVGNQKRTLDPWYQFTVHSVELEVAEYFGICMYTFNSCDVNERVIEALNHIGFSSE